MTQQPNWKGCPVRFAAAAFGDKWSLLILRDMMFMQKRFYHEFANSEEKMATNILANRLNTLTQAGIIQKRTDPKNRTRKIYSLTSKGLDLLPMMLAIIDWAEYYDKQSLVPQKFIAPYRANPKKFEQRLRKLLHPC